MTTMLNYLPSPASRANYSYHIKTFFAFIGSTPDEYVSGALRDTKHVQEDIAAYIEHLKGLTSRRGAPLSGNTIQSAINPIKALLEYNDVRANEINWKKLRKLIPPARKFGKDRAPTVEEIRRILNYTEPRERALILGMASGGFRVGAVSYFTIADFTKLEGGVGRLVIYRDEPEQYTTFVSPEAVRSLDDYLSMRKAGGEVLKPDSPLFITERRTRRTKDYEALTPRAAQYEIFKALARAGLGYGHRDFKQVHGLRKFFKSQAEKAMKSIHVELLMGHSLGLGDSYMKVTEKELLEEYMKGLPHLTISEAFQVKNELEAEKAKYSGLERTLDMVWSELSDLKMRVSMMPALSVPSGQPRPAPGAPQSSPEATLGRS